MFLKALGAAFAPAGIFMILSVIGGFIIAITTPAGAGNEMGGGFVLPLALVFGAIASFIIYISSCIIFFSCGISPKLFWWITITPNALLLLFVLLFILANFHFL